MTRLEAEKVLMNINFGETLEVNGVAVTRVASPFGDGPRFFVYRDGRQYGAGPKGDPYHVLSEAACCVLATVKGGA